MPHTGGRSPNEMGSEEGRPVAKHDVVRAPGKKLPAYDTPGKSPQQQNLAGTDPARIPWASPTPARVLTRQCASEVYTPA